MKNIILYLLISIVFLASCNSEETTSNTNETNKTKTEEKLKEDSTYAQYIAKNKIAQLTAKGFAYKFGEPDGEGSILYSVKYNEKGKILDSLIYNDNKVIAMLSNEYDANGNLLLSMIKDSAGNTQQKIEKTYDENDQVLTFRLVKGNEVIYSQKMTYEDDKMTKIVEFDELGNPRIVTQYEYNENGKLITNKESKENGDLLKKTSFVYDQDGNNSVQTIYNSLGQVAEKNFLKNYDKNGNARLVEKYDKNDSLIVTYQYEYNDKGDEIKSIIYDGIGQIIRQSMSSFDSNGNQIGFEIYEGGKGFVGKDKIKYNEQNQEIELIVVDKNDKQIKRKVTSYNKKGLIKDVINYDKLDEPNFMISFEYQYYK